MNEALIAWHHNQIDKAREIATQALVKNPHWQNALVLGVILFGTGKREEGLALLRKTLITNPTAVPVRAQLASMIKIVERAKTAEAQAEIAERRAMGAAVKAVLERAPFFKPSELWENLAGFHERLLNDFGIANFKRTLAHQYQNWLISREEKEQWIALRKIWEKDPTDQPVLNDVELPDDAGFYLDPRNPFYMLANINILSIYTLAVGILWEFALKTDKVGFLTDHVESPIGNPISIRRKGQLISQDAAHSSREMNALFAATGISVNDGLTIAELGAGQGRLAEMIGRKTNFRYMIFDIFPTLYVSQWYIQKIFPNEKIFTFRDFDKWEDVADEVKNSRIAFFTPNQMKLLPDASVDIFINICSLQEMGSAHIKYFLQRSTEITRRTIFLKQYYESQNSDEGLTVYKKDYSVAPKFDLIVDEPDEVDPRIFVNIWKRNAT